MQIQRDIPTDVDPPTLGPVSTGLGEIYQYVVRPKKDTNTSTMQRN